MCVWIYSRVVGRGFLVFASLFLSVLLHLPLAVFYPRARGSSLCKLAFRGQRQMKVTGMTFHGGNKSNSDFPSCHLKRVRFFFFFSKRHYKKSNSSTSEMRSICEYPKGISLVLRPEEFAEIQLAYANESVSRLAHDDTLVIMQVNLIN